MAGCDVAAKYNSYDVHMAPALRSGRLDIFSNSIVREVMVSTENRATGVRFIDRRTTLEGEARARCVVVSCACAQSVALLLMSRSRLYPDGLGNSSGQLGKNFIPHFTGGVEAFLTDLIGKPAVNDEGFLDHAYVPSFMHTRKRDYARSFGMQFNYQNRRSVGWAREIKGFGRTYKDAVKNRFRRFWCFHRTARCFQTANPMWIWIGPPWTSSDCRRRDARLPGATTIRRSSRRCSIGRWRS